MGMQSSAVGGPVPVLAHRFAAASVVLTLAAVAVAVALPGVVAGSAGPLVGVIVRYSAQAGAESAERAVTRLGGSVGRSLGIIGAFTARVPAPALGRCGTRPGWRRSRLTRRCG
jgi:hypothetical protein